MKFTKDDLQNGLILEDGYSNRYIYIENQLLGQRIGFKSFDNFDYELVNTFNDEASIMKVYKTRTCVLEDIFKDKYLEIVWERPEPPLNDKEYEYLSNVVKPFRDTITSILKNEYCYNGVMYEHIIISYITVDSGYGNHFTLPSFKKGEMYQGMELSTPYILEELGL